MAETGSRRQRVALLGGLTAAVVAISAGVAVNGLPSAGHNAAISVTASKPLPPLQSDLLSDPAAKERDRELRQRYRGDSVLDPTAIASAVPAEPVEPADPAVAGIPAFEGRAIDCTRVKCVALTFDDGPGSQTDELLAMLRSANAVATWFPIGEVVADNPDRLRKIAEAGMEIGNHSWNHPELTRLSDTSVASQITRTSREVESVTGHKPYLMRPPYGAVSKRVVRDLGRLGSPAILWDVDPLDWKYPNSDRVYREVMRQVRPGSIVLMHDIHPTTVAAVPRILKALSARGYTFVTVSELFAGQLVPGRIYTDRHAAYRPED